MAVHGLTGVLIFLVLYLFWRINRYEAYLMKINQRMVFIRDKMISTMTTEEMLMVKQDPEYQKLWNDLL